MKLNLPEGSHEAVLGSPQNAEMALTWSAITVDTDRRVVEVYGMNEGRTVLDVIPVLSYAHVAKAAFAMCSAAAIADAEFDPAEFGRRCADIAREQLTRYQQVDAEVDAS